MKPEWCPQWAWDKAKSCIETREFMTFPPKNSCAIIARALLDAHQRGRREGMEEAAKVAEGEVYHHCYRTWPFWPEQKDGGRGNRSNESELVKHCDQIAAAIRAKAQEVKT